MSVSVVVPCYRSAGTLPKLVERLGAVMPGVTNTYEVILVVDGSPDRETWDVASHLARLHPQVQAIRLARNYGQHNALIAGVRAARHDIVVTMDDDLQHPPEEVPKLLAALTDDLDVVYGKADHEEHGLMRSLGSRVLKAGMSGALGVQNARYLSAFRVFRTFLRDGFEHLNGPHISVDVVLSWATSRVGATSVRMEDRAEGRSGYTARALIKHGLDIMLGYSTKPLRLVTYLGLLVGLCGLVLTAVVLWTYFSGNTTIAGFTTLASMVALFASAQMIAIGALGEYVGRIHSSGMGRPTYVIRERATGGEGVDHAEPRLTEIAHQRVAR